MSTFKFRGFKADTTIKGGNNMERTRIGLIFIGLCLALVFSVSPVEAQQCDKDDDMFNRIHRNCDPGFLDDQLGFDIPTDCNDNDASINLLADEVCDDGIDNNCNGVVDEECGDPEPPDDGGTKGSPIIVTFDDWDGDSIQSDDPGTHRYLHDGLKTGVSAIGNCSSILVLS